MKKIAKGLAIAIGLLILALVTYVLVSFPPIMRGMAAKTLCSCLFVSGRTQESVNQKELQVVPGMTYQEFDINTIDSTVTVRLLGNTSKAIYRKGLGCTLLSEASEAQVRSQSFTGASLRYPDQDSIAWPMGDLYAFTTAENINRDAVDRVVDKAFADNPEKPVNTHAVVVVYNGKIIAERYAKGFDKNSVMTGWSMTKSITNALIGILVRQGKLNIDDPAPVAEWKHDERSAITLNHLMQASSGLAWSESYFIPGADFHNMFIHSDDKAGYALSKPLEYPPGTFFEYSSGTTNILSRIIRQTVGESYHRFPYEELFEKTGMYHALIEPDASGTFVASSYGHASARDWARLGLLYLNDGIWNGERILPDGWVSYSTTPGPAASQGQYGAQIWLNQGASNDPANCKFPGLPRESIIFSGFEDNFVVIVPSKELIVVRLGVTHNDGFDLADLVSGVISQLPEEENLAHERVAETNARSRPAL